MTKMGNFRAVWQQAPVMYTNEFEIPKDGTYRVVIEEVTYTEADRDNNPTDPTYIYILRVKEGEYANSKFRRYQTIKTEKNLSFLKGDLNRLGIVCPSDPEDIIFALQRAKGLTIDVTIKSRTFNGKEYKDINIDKLVRDQQPQQQQYQQQPQQQYQQQQSFGGNYPPDDCPF